MGAGSNELFERLLAHHEIPLDAVTLVHGDLASHAEAISASKIDAFSMVVARSNPALEAIVEATPNRLVPIDQAEAMALFDPALEASLVPVGTYSGERPVPSRPIPVVAVRSL